MVVMKIRPSQLRHSITTDHYAVPPWNGTPTILNQRGAAGLIVDRGFRSSKRTLSSPRSGGNNVKIMWNMSVCGYKSLEDVTLNLRSKSSAVGKAKIQQRVSTVQGYRLHIAAWYFDDDNNKNRNIINGTQQYRSTLPTCVKYYCGYNCRSDSRRTGSDCWGEYSHLDGFTPKVNIYFFFVITCTLTR